MRRIRLLCLLLATLTAEAQVRKIVQAEDAPKQQTPHLVAVPEGVLTDSPTNDTRKKAAVEDEARKAQGVMFKDVEMKNLAGETVRLSRWVGRGNYVLVDFWASWCGPCRMEMPNVKEAYAKFHPKGFEIVGISLDNKQEAWEKGVTDLGITWPQMSDLQGWKCVGASLYNIRSIPATILFAPDGTVVEAGLRGEALSQKLAEIYASKKLSE